jgi:hypothetical protein
VGKQGGSKGPGRKEPGFIDNGLKEHHVRRHIRKTMRWGRAGRVFERENASMNNLKENGQTLSYRSSSFIHESRQET